MKAEFLPSDDVDGSHSATGVLSWLAKKYQTNIHIWQPNTNSQLLLIGSAKPAREPSSTVHIMLQNAHFSRLKVLGDRATVGNPTCTQSARYNPLIYCADIQQT